MLITAAYAASNPGEPWTADPSNWVAIGFVIFLALMFFLKVHAKLGSALDGRADRIRSELEEAKRLREDARIATSPGDGFGTGGEFMERFNLATQRSRVEEACRRLIAAFSDLQ